ncbi:hypothetical protein [Thiocapsa sp. UBA6158]|uniref:hypothetical protein n=1 Tax=Thiocapsa sp. UBA6158 TaxID=1947692 RepID=UPI0025EAE1A5|nr:hypothetical protein [Thiocapsa sp. UBA6158]
MLLLAGAAGLAPAAVGSVASALLARTIEKTRRNGINPNGFEDRRCSEWPEIPAVVLIIGIDIVIIGSQKNSSAIA